MQSISLVKNMAMGKAWMRKKNGISRSWLCMVPLDKLVTVSCGNMNGARSTPWERVTLPLHRHRPWHGGCGGHWWCMLAYHHRREYKSFWEMVGVWIRLRCGLGPGCLHQFIVSGCWLLSSHYLNIRVNLVKCFMKIKMLVLL